MKPKGTIIHPTALVESGAEIGDGVEIGPYCCVGAKVKLGDRTRLLKHVVVEGNTELGSDNEIHPFAVIGAKPQDLKYRGQDTQAIIGDGNIFREGVTVNVGTEEGGGITRIGDQNAFLANSHVAHDCLVGSNIVMSNGVLLAGHVIIQDHVVIGGGCAISQRKIIGESAFIYGMSGVNIHVPPFVVVRGVTAYFAGVNFVGLRRRGMSAHEISELKALYQVLLVESSPSLSERIEGLALGKAKIGSNLQKVHEFLETTKASGLPKPGSAEVLED